ncbi:TIGR02450 family Trp-rich protein [Leeia sp. TBRC 13508]|uniref:TIGR02450 family Trp-rich protein n=1 Tax=Leeia speluncae TaxID=2884804 RepID=A0ABS8DAX4_9NEIS|nr:TIGR02450 family Trp-rich protein [Leeia speluncae]MCB6185363.1 TIGR02450 family Trp-rich protein [Leeia speluncae]
MANLSLNPKKLMRSKWTAVTPQNKEKHFLVIEVITPEDGSPIRQIVLEAILTKRTWTMDWEQLEDTSRWIQGWR